ncbi:NAD-dependent malic enzyme 2, mitochondrial [Tetrabaena socialis]|uniref:NAD-dependent malic enzyme 2, mitochondrial n=1 Tax=Tetrabaena socialis TaxID=47790 RepID=A0A2J7ZTN3_9CHLO|nr:NAD-dependent malic enzyme 2, mitochondrial [Tetrabaena socialis]|eukprot:PNH03635.1 NAD-dependent malic enzyme 2, mitochondrial [Tetrabaena socialis]
MFACETAPRASMDTVQAGNALIPTVPALQPPAHVVRKTGVAVLHDPLINKGSAFPRAERDRLGLRGLLPPRGLTLELQAARFMEDYHNPRELIPPEDVKLGGVTTEMARRWKLLQELQNRNETLFYKVLFDNFTEMAPIIYTPTVGWVSRGMYFSAEDRGDMAAMVYNWPHKDVQAIVVTDGSRILGLGDLGINGELDGLLTGFQRAFAFPQLPMFLTPPGPLLNRYRKHHLVFNDDIQGTAATALAGMYGAMRVNGLPASALAQQRVLCVGAGSAGMGVVRMIAAGMQKHGLSAERAGSQFWVLDYQGLITRARPGVADFVKPYARPEEDAAFEGEGLLSVVKRVRLGIPIGKLDLYCAAAGFSPSKVLPVVIDVGTNNLALRNDPLYAGLRIPRIKGTEYFEIIDEVRPTILLGLAGAGRLFTEEVLAAMAEGCAASNLRPIIFPMSNPTSKMECTAEEAVRVTRGAAIFASGSPQPPVQMPDGRELRISQANNMWVGNGSMGGAVDGALGTRSPCHVGLALGAYLGETRIVSDGMMMAAAEELPKLVTPEDLSKGLVYPRLSDIREISVRIATAVASAAGDEGRLRGRMREKYALGEEAMSTFISRSMYRPDYSALVHLEQGIGE